MLSNYSHLKDTIKIILAVVMIVALLFIIIGFSTHNLWDNTPCEQVLEFDVTLTYDDHLGFLDRYNYCLAQS